MSRSQSSAQMKGLTSPAFQQLLAGAAKVGRDSNDPEKNPWSAPKYQTGVPTFHPVYRATIRSLLSNTNLGDSEQENKQTLGEGINELGQHWTSDPEVAEKYAKYSPYWERYAKESSVYEGLVHDSDTWHHDDPKSIEHFDHYGIYHPKSDINDADFGEKEITIKSDSPVKILNRTDYSALKTPRTSSTPINEVGMVGYFPTPKRYEP